MVQVQEMDRWHGQLVKHPAHTVSRCCLAVVVGVVQPAIMSTYGHRRGLL